MKIELLFFGIATDLVGETKLTYDVNNITTIEDLQASLIRRFPKLKNLHEFAIAVNEEYANDGQLLKKNDVVAIIPPVSGG